MPSEHKRKLAAIMFTDIVGYSNIMSLNEKKGIKILERHNEIINPVIVKNNGNILKRMGDAIFAEFASSVDAVRCAIEIQTALKEYNSDKSLDDMIIIRIGIHLGDVMIHGDDLFGEGINVAARLEPLAAPGGICLSQAVYQSVTSHLDLSAIRVGEMELKNIIEKYVIYKIPPFYAEEITETSVSVIKGEKRIYDFKIDNIKRMPPPQRSYRSSLLIMFMLVFSAMIVGFSVGFMDSPTMLRPREFRDPAGFIAKLHDTDNPISQYIKGKLLAETVKLIDEYENHGSVPYSLKKVIGKDLSHLLTRGNLLFDEQALEYLDISQEFSEMIEKNPTGNDLVDLNRLLLGRAFPNEITERPLPIFLAIIEAGKGFLYEKIELRTIIIVIVGISLLILGAAYTIAFATIQVRFADVRHTDEMLEHFVEQMGFKPPTREHGNLVFKPSLSKYIKEIFVGFPTKIMARIEGNSVVITSTIPTVKQLTKRLNAFSN